MTTTSWFATSPWVAGWSAVLAGWVAWRWWPRPAARQPDRLESIPDEPGPTGRRPIRLGRVTFELSIEPRSADAVAGTLALAGWCDDVARSIRAGDTLATAVADSPRVGTHAAGLDAIAGALQGGTTILNDRERHPDLGLVTTVLAACQRHGGGAAEPLDRAATTLRGRAAHAGDVRVQSAQARWSAQVMTALPLAMLTVLLAASPEVRTIAMTPVGLASLLVGGVLNLAGWWWLHRLLARVGPC